MDITDILCYALQQKSQDILNAMHLVSSIKVLIQKLREDGWNNFFDSVILFSKKYDIDILNLDA